MLTVSDIINAKSRIDKSFGIDCYRMPKEDTKYKTKHILPWTKKKQGERYLDIEAKRSKSIPDPTKYSKIVDWTKSS